ncbi:polyribonucleotide nucleotidyltransferase [Haliscomenobacter sp.]|uniref:polyribonucleotide nucleotidyltransferase n=1 Tax=Haliscomenobacter sp. TaxID=2717303 RepID=UPI00359368E9
MGQQIPITKSFNLPDGREVIIETGKLATQADGSVVVRCGNTMIFAVATSDREARAGQDFFPLSVDYQEKFASSGRIPGNFFRRETKLSDYEILCSRLVDRAIRPLFPNHYMNDTQIMINLISVEKNEMPDAFVALAASAALSVSDIPFQGPISEVRVARINGEFVINPGKDVLKTADIDLIVAATLQDITMVEGEAKEMDEDSMIEALRIAHEAIKVQCHAQIALAQLVGDKALIKRDVPPLPEDEEVLAKLKELVVDKIRAVASSASDKNVRKKKFEEVKKEAEVALSAAYGEEAWPEKKSFFKRYFDVLKKKTVREVILDGVRLDGRGPSEIRHIWSEVDYLPSTHGSAIFTRGETQALTSLTLGTKTDEQMIDNSQEMYHEKFILHYNFPGYSVGEVKPNRGPGRREVGHANLAARSLRKVMPADLPYTVRIVSDILESNGSSSMATVCAGTLALMDAGIKITAPVSGIAMGMIKEGDRVAILSDILGDEDALGDMDFKVTGTENGITGCQMDIKIDGLPYDLLIRALNQAREGRLHILNEMKKTIEAPREDYKPHAPRIVEIIIDKSYIGAVIGPGGKVIQEIQATTGTQINIEEKGDKGHVTIASANKDAIDKAIEWVNRITFSPTVGDVFRGVVKSVMPYGVFVDFNGKSGLLHVSEISHTRIDNVEDVLKEGDEIKVQLVEVDKKTGKMRLSRKSLLPRPPGMEDNGGGDNGGGGSERRGGGEYRGGGGDRGGDRRGGGGDRGGDRRGGGGDRGGDRGNWGNNRD